MRRIRTIRRADKSRRAGVVFACAIAVVAASGVPFQTLPPEVRAILDEKFPGWTLTPLMQPVREELRVRSPGGDANIISGDFDGNGRPDYVVLLEHSTPEIDEAVALLNDGKSFTLVSLQRFPPDRRRYVTLEKKGTRGNAHDAIGIWLVGAGGEIYTYANGRFTPVAQKE